MSVTVGATGPSLTFGPVTQKDIVRYAGASLDLNPIHYDEAFARSAGYRGPFAQGMLSAGWLSSFVTSWFGPASVRRFSARFREIVWLGDVLTAHGVVTAVRGDDAGRAQIAELDLRLVNQHGVAVVTGAALVRLPH